MSDRRGGEREQPPERRASERGRERRDGGVRNVTQRSAHLHGNCVHTLADFSEEDLGERCWWRKGQETWVEGASLRSLSICHPSLPLSSGTRSTFLQNSEGCFFFLERGSFAPLHTHSSRSSASFSVSFLMLLLMIIHPFIFFF